MQDSAANKMNSEVDGKEGEEMNPGGDSASASSSTENPKDGCIFRWIQARSLDLTVRSVLGRELRRRRTT